MYFYVGLIRLRQISAPNSCYKLSNISGTGISVVREISPRSSDIQIRVILRFTPFKLQNADEFKMRMISALFISGEAQAYQEFEDVPFRSFASFSNLSWQLHVV